MKSKFNYRNIINKITVLCLLATIGISTPCFCKEKAYLKYSDKELLTNNEVWLSLSEEDRFEFMIRFVPLINSLLGQPADAFPVENIHMMERSDPNYNVSCAYTDYKTGQVYVNIEGVNRDGAVGGWAAVYALAHETRHLYQDRFNTIPNDPNATIHNMAVYANDPRENDANAFAKEVYYYLVNSVS